MQRRLPARYCSGLRSGQIIEKIGKPDQIENKDPNAPRWVYNKKTFDPDNLNRSDDKTIVVMKKDPKTGKLVGAEVLFL